MRSYLFAAVPILLSLGLLASVRMDVPKQGFAYLLEGEDKVHRGEDMRTNEKTWSAYGVSLNGVSRTKVYLDYNTTLTLVDASTATPKIAIREGRIVTTGPIDILVRDTVVHADGTATFVFYSWLDKLDVAILGEKPETYSVDTLHNSRTPSPQHFEPQTSSAHDFYTWALDSAIN